MSAYKRIAIETEGTQTKQRRSTKASLFAASESGGLGGGGAPEKCPVLYIVRLLTTMRVQMNHGLTGGGAGRSVPVSGHLKIVRQWAWVGLAGLVGMGCRSGSPVCAIVTAPSVLRWRGDFLPRPGGSAGRAQGAVTR